MSDDEKEQKPKKYAQLSVLVWDDAEVDIEAVRFIKTGSGRGAPKKVVMLDPKQFVEDLETDVLNVRSILKLLIRELDLEDKLEVVYKNDKDAKGGTSDVKTPKAGLTVISNNDDADDEDDDDKDEFGDDE